MTGFKPTLAMNKKKAALGVNMLIAKQTNLNSNEKTKTICEQCGASFRADLAL